MAITLLGQPDEFAPGYNPMYFYASSTNATQPNFRYLVDLYLYDPITTTYTTLANLKIKPRFGDNYLEVNVNKILQSRLNNALDEFINADSTGIFYDNSGYIYTICIGETYLGQWDFYFITNTNGNLNLVSSSPSPYAIGDIIVTNGIANVNEYSSITDNGGYTQINLTTPHDFTTNDAITIVQNSPFEYPQYNGQYYITDATDPDYLVINLPFQGASTLEQTGTTTRNGFLDATCVVVDVYQVGDLYIVETDIPLNVNFPDASDGFVNFVSGELSVFQSEPTGSVVTGTYRDSLRVFPGVIGHNSFPDYTSDIYNYTTPGQQFISTLPNPWTVTPDSAIWLNIWSENGLDLSDYVEIKTYDCEGNLLQTEQIDNLILSADASMIQSVAVGPSFINSTYGNNVVTGSNFEDPLDWSIVNYDNSNTFISDGFLTYEDASEFGGTGYSYTTQTGILEIGQTYTVILFVQNNLNCAVTVGDTTLYPIVSNDQTGTFTVTFLAAGTDFNIQIIATDEFSNGIEISAVIVNLNDGPDLINCDTVCSYTVQVFGTGESSPSQLSEVRTFNLDCSCIGRYTNYSLSFVDRLNSVGSFSFTLNNKQKVNVKREKFNRQIGGLSTTNSRYEYNTSETSNPNYSIELNEQWELNTNWLTETESVYFEELITSPRVVLVDGNVFTAVNIVDATFERVRKNNKKMIQHTITIELANNNGIQTG